MLSSSTLIFVSCVIVWKFHVKCGGQSTFTPTTNVINNNRKNIYIKKEAENIACELHGADRIRFGSRHFFFLFSLFSFLFSLFFLSFRCDGVHRSTSAAHAACKPLALGREWSLHCVTLWYTLPYTHQPPFPSSCPHLPGRLFRGVVQI